MERSSNDWDILSHRFSRLDDAELADMANDLNLAIERTENERQVQVLQKVLGRLAFEVEWRIQDELKGKSQSL